MNNLNKLQKLLKAIDKDKTYFNIHAGDVLGSVFLIIAFILIFTFISVKKSNVIIRKEWQIHRCKPNISAIAGFIKHPPDATFDDKAKITAQNYASCNVGILEQNMQNFTKPLTNMQSIIKKIFDIAKKALKQMHTVYALLQNKMFEIIKLIFMKISQVGIQLQKFMFKVRDTLAKAAGTLQAGFLIIVAQAYLFMTFINNMVRITITMLIIVTIIMIAMFIWTAIMWWGPWPGFLAAAIGLLITYLCMAISLIIVIIFFSALNDYMDRQEDMTCFHPDTKVRIKNGTYKSMKDLHLGEILYDDNEVIAVLRIKGDEDNVYYKIYNEELNDYIYVTGTHYILDSKTKRYIFVEKYKNAVKTNTWTNEMSCLVTSSHKIKLGEHTFTDWEDIF